MPTDTTGEGALTSDHLAVQSRLDASAREAGDLLIDGPEPMRVALGLLDLGEPAERERRLTIFGFEVKVAAAAACPLAV